MYLRQIIFAFAGLLCLATRVAAYDNFLPGSRFLALSQCGTAIPDIWSVSENQAGLSFLTKPSFSISSERRYMMKELSVHSLAVVYPMQKGSLGSVFNYYGFSKYHELKTGIAYSLYLSQKLSAGIMLDYFSSNMDGTSKHLNRITAEFGLMSKPIKNLTIGLHIFNPFPEKTNIGQNVILPSLIKFGLAYKIHSIVTLATETQIGTQQKANYKFGIEYFPVENLALRMGLKTWTAEFSGGIAYSWKHFEAGFAFAQHPILGNTTSIDLTYSIF